MNDGAKKALVAPLQKENEVLRERVARTEDLIQFYLSTVIPDLSMRLRQAMDERDKANAILMRQEIRG